MSTLPPADTTDPITAPTACAPYTVGDGITVLPAYLPVPGMGVLPAHSFLLDGPEPMLVDTGPGGAEAGVQSALTSIVDPADLRWLWLTHTDPDHIGSLTWLLDAAPDLTVITTYLAVGKLSMSTPLPLERVMWVNPGTTVELNGRTLHALRPPSYDAPETTAVFDATSQTLFPADTFGALLHTPVADTDAVDAPDLVDGMTLWATIDAPWVTHTDRSHFAASLTQLRTLDARRVLSSHLPPAHDRTDLLLDTLAAVPGADPWIGPDQTALDAIRGALTP
jgi:glyoxylase-like metal-dependent hydrolase (beta-lactamase superfamily II)